MILFFDTALTGRYHYREADDAAVQPHLARLGIAVVNDSGTPILEEVHLIKPKRGWRYEVEAIAAHHIAPAVAEEQGIELGDAMLPFIQAMAEATELVAFNYDHHSRAILRAFIDLGIDQDLPLANEPKAFCAMRLATPYTRLQRMGPGGGYRWPKMVEAYQHFARDDLLQSLDPIDQGRLNLRAVRMIHDGIVEAGQRAL